MIPENPDERMTLATRRTLLANERTYLAWVRTGLACTGGGFAVTRFLTFQNPLHAKLAYLAGFLLVLLGSGIFLWSYLNFRYNYKKLETKQQPMHVVAMIAFMTLLLFGITSLLITLMIV